MDITDSRIDAGRPFDFGRTSEDYARFRDIYPEEFYQKIVDRGLCVKGQRVLDIGTGTGVLPRNMYRYGAQWTAADISENQIAYGRSMAEKAGMDISFAVSSAEDMSFEENSFDVVTACQCFWYFDHSVLMPKLSRFLRPGGTLLILYMAWLPFEDPIAGESERLVLRYNPVWSGAGEERRPLWIPEAALEYFTLEDHEEYDIRVPFTRQTWHGRMKACRGAGASLSPQDLAKWEKEHIEMLQKKAPESFEVLHYAALAVLKSKRTQ